MTDDEFNEWETSSGLPLDGATVEVTGIEWGRNNAIDPQRLFGNFTFSDLESGEEHEQSFSVGKGWETDRTGQMLEPVNKNRRKLQINDSTTYGILLDSAVECLGGKAAAGKELGGSPRDIHIWLGTQWVMGTIQMTTQNPQTGEEKQASRYVFVEYLGRSGEDNDAEEEEEVEEVEEKPKGKARNTARNTTKASPKGSPSSAKSRSGGSASKSKDSSKSQKTSTPNGIDRETWDALVETAKEIMGKDEDNTHDDFVDEVIEWDSVDDDKNVQKAVMSTKAGSVWAAAQA